MAATPRLITMIAQNQILARNGLTTNGLLHCSRVRLSASLLVQQVRTKKGFGGISRDPHAARELKKQREQAAKHRKVKLQTESERLLAMERPLTMKSLGT